MLRKPGQRGVTLIELVVVMVILGIALALAIPSFSTWLAGARIRATAEGLLAGLQYARSEATTRNTQVRFQLTTSLDAGCARSSSDGNWVVDVVDADSSVDSVEGQCDAAPDGATPPGILQIRAAAETGKGTVVAADADQVIFNGLGRQAPATAGTPVSTVSIDVTSSQGDCAADGGSITCLRIVVSPAGLVRMCNPRLAAGDPQGC